MDEGKEKEKFIKSQIFYLTIMGGLSRGYIYRKGATEFRKNIFKKFLKKQLEYYGKIYKNGVEPDEHIENIKEFKKNIEEEFSDVLQNNKLRFGTSQKLLNLYLKYLWSLNWIKKPPHCPFDSIIISKLGKEFKKIFLTKFDDEESYKKLVEAARKISVNNIAGWELEYFNNYSEKQNISSYV